MSKELEIERKFLLRRMPELEFDYKYLITQYYSRVGKPHRVRECRFSEGTKYFRTEKSFVDEMSMMENEWEIPHKEYMKGVAAWQRGEAGLITKMRHVKLIEDDLKWEVDNFLNISMVTAEIELPSKEYSVDIADWPDLHNELILEVTGTREFSNNRMSVILSK